MTFRPASMTVLPAADARGRIPARVCLLAEDGVEFRIYALHGGGGDGGAQWGTAATSGAKADEEDTSMMSV